VGCTVRETYYGPQHSYTSPNSGGELIPFDQAGVGLTDLEVRYNITEQLQFAVGGNNVFNIQPDTIPFAPSYLHRKRHHQYHIGLRDRSQQRI